MRMHSQLPASLVFSPYPTRIIRAGLLAMGALTFFVTAAALAADAPPGPPPGRRVQLTDGMLFIPVEVNSGVEDIELTLHLHGAPAVVEKQFVNAKQPGVLANITLPGLSAVYAERFRDTNVLWRILDDSTAQLKPAGSTNGPRIRRVTVTSFSAGFGGVRELLRDPAAFARIDAIVMGDSIYAGFTGDATDRKVNPENMAGFLKFAREAVEGRKRLVISHTQLPTPTYASTVETADYLIAQLGGRREMISENWPGDLKLLSRFQKGQLEILGFAGDTGEEHMKHLRNLGLFLERLRLPH
jgi:hypothetical protein